MIGKPATRANPGEWEASKSWPEVRARWWRRGFPAPVSSTTLTRRLVSGASVAPCSRSEHVRTGARAGPSRGLRESVSMVTLDLPAGTCRRDDRSTSVDEVIVEVDRRLSRQLRRRRRAAGTLIQSDAPRGPDPIY